MSFPPNEISQLLDLEDGKWPYNLGESTSLNYQVKDLSPLSKEELADKILNLELGYGSAQGSMDLRKAISDDAQSDISPDDIVITIGSVSSLFLVSFILCSEDGDECLVTTPNFPPSIDCLSALGIKVNFLKLDFENGYQIDLEKFSESMNSKIKLVSIPSPGNPSGVTISNETLKKLISIVKEKSPNAYILIDETYREAVLNSNPIDIPAAAIDERVISTSSLSKAVGAPGIRIGWLISKDKELVKKLVIAKMNIIICCPTIEEFLATEIFKKKEELLQKQREHLSTAISILKDWIVQNNDWVDWVEPDRGALCCLKLKEDKISDEEIPKFYNFCKSKKLLLGKGSWFYESDRCFRLGFGFLDIKTFEFSLGVLSTCLQNFNKIQE